MPSEHGGWGLTAEPIVLGLLVAPSWAGLAVGLAAIIAFLARTPLKIALGDLRRGRRLKRTGTAAVLATGELTFLVVLVTLAVMLGEGSWWLPALLASPLFALELWYDVRSRGRRLVPELAGAVGIAAVGAAIVLAGGAPEAAAFGVWAILAARAMTSIPYVRSEVRRLHGRPDVSEGRVAWDALAVSLVVVAALVEPVFVFGSLVVTALVVLQRLSILPAAGSAVVLGLRQTAMGLGIVAATWAGVLVAGPL